MPEDQDKKRIRRSYAQLAKQSELTPAGKEEPAQTAGKRGYSADQIAGVPEETIQMGLGCGNPTASRSSSRASSFWTWEPEEGWTSSSRSRGESHREVARTAHERNAVGNGKFMRVGLDWGRRGMNLRVCKARNRSAKERRR